MPTKPIGRDVAVLVGSLRKGSFNRKLAAAMTELAQPRLALRIVEYRDLPIYDEDLEVKVPGPWQAFRDDVRTAEAVLFVTPEYNRSVPGGLKNAIDVGSRPYGKSVFVRKPAAVISVSTGALGGFGANHHLRQSLVFLDMPVLQQPEMYVGSAKDKFDAEGRLTCPTTTKLLVELSTAFAAWIDKTRAAS